MGLITDIAINGNKARKIDDINSLFDLDNINVYISDRVLTRYHSYCGFIGFDQENNTSPSKIKERIRECIEDHKKDICRLILKHAVPMLVHMHGQGLFDGHTHYYSRLKGHTEGHLTRLINKAVPEGIRNINHLGWPKSFEYETAYSATRYRRDDSDTYRKYTQIVLYPKGMNPDQYWIKFEIPQEVNYHRAKDPAASCFNGSLTESPQAFDSVSP